MATAHTDTGTSCAHTYIGEGDYTDRNPEETPRIILLDLKLPKIDGLQVLERLRAYRYTKLVPVIILTSSKEEQDLISGYQNGANSYVRKPVDFIVDMTEALHRLPAGQERLVEPPPQSAQQRRLTRWLMRLLYDEI